MLCYRFGSDVMEMVASWTKGLCNDIARGQMLNQVDDGTSVSPEQGEKDSKDWSVLDVGTGNGLLLQEFAKQGYFLKLFTSICNMFGVGLCLTVPCEILT